MIFEECKIKGAFLIKPTPFVDDRGAFRRNFCIEEFKKHGLNPNVNQANVSENNFKYTIRGFHYQMEPHGEAKTLTCLKGAIYDIIVDLRPDSATYMKWEAFELNPINRHSIHVPVGCAHAFLTLKDDTLVHYYCSMNYVSSADTGVRYNDPQFKFKWPHEPELISDKDKNWPDYKPKEKATVK